MYQPSMNKKHLASLLALLLTTALSTLASDIDALQGKWKLTKSGENGAITQLLEFKRDKWTFKRISEDGNGFVAEGDVEVKNTGAFQTIHIHTTKYGDTETNMEDADDERDFVFSVQDGKLYIATNLDLERENEKPALDVYSRNPDAGKTALAGSWKLNLDLGDDNYDYTLRITESAGKLNAVMVSPRSGEHQVNSINFENNTLRIEIDREIQGNVMTFVYTGKLEGQKLSGHASVKGANGDEIASGEWTAKK